MAHNPINPDKGPSHINLNPKVYKLGDDEAKAGEKLPKIALVYQILAELAGLAAAAKDTTISTTVGVTPPPPVHTSGDVVDDFIVLLDSIKGKEYVSAAAAFVRKLLEAGIDIAAIDSKAAQGLFADELKMRLGGVLQDKSQMKALGIALADAYKTLSHNASDTKLLKGALEVIFGASNPAVASILRMYSASVQGDNEIMGVADSHGVLGAGMDKSSDWQSDYDKLMRQLSKGNVDFDLMMRVLGNAPPGSDIAMKKLAKLLHPLISGTNRNAFARMLSLYFARAGDAAGSINRVEKFLNSIVKYFVKDPANPSNDPYFKKLEELLERTKSMMAGTGGPFDPENPMSQKEINSELATGAVSFAKAVGTSIKNQHLLYNGPILMAMYVLLMSSDGAYGYLAKIMGNLNVTMKDIGKFTDDIEKINNVLKDFLEETDIDELAKLAQQMSDLSENLGELLEKFGDKLGDALKERIEKFVKPGGTLDDAVKKANIGEHTNWKDLAADPAACKKMQDYLTATAGGGVGEGATSLITNISQLLGALTTVNQGQLEKLNMTTKKVDSLTKLFSSAITMFKGLTQTLTQYSGS